MTTLRGLLVALRSYRMTTATRLKTIWVLVWLSVFVVLGSEIGIIPTVLGYTLMAAFGSALFGWAAWLNHSGTPDQIIWPGKLGFVWNIANVITVNIFLVVITFVRIKARSGDFPEVDPRAWLGLTGFVVFSAVAFGFLMYFEKFAGPLLGD